MSVSMAHSLGVGARYARAAMSLAQQNAQVDDLEQDAHNVQATLLQHKELKDFLHLPIYKVSDHTQVLEKIAAALSLSVVMKNTLLLMGTKRRLAFIQEFLDTVLALIAYERGQITAYVKSVKPLADTQQKQLLAQLEQSTGQSAKIDVLVDPSLIGGLVVEVGSKMIDNSIKMKLDKLHNTIKR